MPFLSTDIPILEFSSINSFDIIYGVGEKLVKSYIVKKAEEISRLNFE